MNRDNGYNPIEEVHGLTSLTWIFPLTALLLIALFFVGTPRLSRCSLELSTEKRSSVYDVAALGFIVIVYAFFAFYNLGNTKSAESFYRFSDGESVTVSLDGESEIASVMYFSGLNTGSYTLQYSDDGEVFYDAATLSQDYVSIFKWKTAELYVDTLQSPRYVRVVAHGNVWLGELALKRADGTLIAAEGGAELFDEQENVPLYSDYLNSSYFDEIYHARTAYEHIEGVYPYEVSHPPLGKLLIAVGIDIFGLTPFGWRFSGTLIGVLMLPILYLLIKKMFGGIFVPFCGTAIFAFDFMHFTQTRIATIDSYAVFFILLMYLFMYLYVSGGRLRYLALCGVAFGLGIASKWTCFYAGAGLAVIWLIYRLRHFEWKSFLKNCLFCVGFFIVIPAIIYYLSYFAYGKAIGLDGIGMFFKKEYFDTVVQNQEFMFTYHSGVTSEHPYSSRWYQWMLDLRPILYYLQYYSDGSRSSFGAFLNPLLCWAGLVAMGIMAYLAAFRRDKKSGFILIGYLAQLVPWMFIGRITFEYHYFPSSVFLVLALCRIFSLMRENKEHWRAGVGGFTALCVLMFFVFYPVLSGKLTDSGTASALLKWLPSWPF